MSDIDLFFINIWYPDIAQLLISDISVVLTNSG